MLSGPIINARLEKIHGVGFDPSWVWIQNPEKPPMLREQREKVPPYQLWRWCTPYGKTATADPLRLPLASPPRPTSLRSPTRSGFGGGRAGDSRDPSTVWSRGGGSRRRGLSAAGARTRLADGSYARLPLRRPMIVVIYMYKVNLEFSTGFNFTMIVVIC